MNKFNNGKSKTEYYIFKCHTFALVYLFDFVFVCLFVCFAGSALKVYTHYDSVVINSSINIAGT